MSESTRTDNKTICCNFWGWFGILIRLQNQYTSLSSVYKEMKVEIIKYYVHFIVKSLKWKQNKTS